MMGSSRRKRRNEEVKERKKNVEKVRENGKSVLVVEDEIAIAACNLTNKMKEKRMLNVKEERRAHISLLFYSVMRTEEMKTSKLLKVVVDYGLTGV